MIKPKFRKGIILCATKNYSFALGTMILNINFYDNIDVIYIVHDGISEKDKEVMVSNSKSKIIFLKFTNEDFIRNIKTFTTKNNINLENVFSKTINRYTFMSFARFEALKLLEECSNIVYLDFDMIIQSSIEDLYKIDTDIALHEGGVSIKYALGFTELMIDCNKNNYQTSIILFTDKIKKPIDVYNSIYKYISTNIDNLSNANLPDQGVFTVVAIKHKLKVFFLDSNIWSACSTWVSSDKAKIVHAFGSKTKFWNNKLISNTRPIFNMFYNRWKELGGSSYQGEIYYEDEPSGGKLYNHMENVLICKSIISILKKDFFIHSDMNFSSLNFVLFYPTLNDYFELSLNKLPNNKINCIINNSLYKEKKLNYTLNKSIFFTLEDSNIIQFYEFVKTSCLKLNKYIVAICKE